MEFNKEKGRAEAAELTRAALDFRERFAQKFEVQDSAALRLTVITNFERPVSKLPRERRKEFRAHLKGLIRKAIVEAQPAGATSDAKPGESVVVASSEPAAIGACCAFCKGSCCRSGDVRAYLDEETIREYAANNPGVRAGRVFKAYLAKLPEETFTGSCVFHGTLGCGLTRKMRSAVCNNHFCIGLKGLRNQIRSEGPKALLLVAAERAKILRSAVIEPDGKTTRHEVSEIGEGENPPRD